MLVLDPSGSLVDRTVRDLPQYLEAGDVMVLNDSRVLPARLIGRRRDGGEAEVLLLRPLPEGQHRWEALIRPARRLEVGSQVLFEASALAVTVEERNPETAVIHLNGLADPLAEVRRIGQMPTPPYIKEHLADGERYQTVYARAPGAVAAPTAGLHFDEPLLAALAALGVQFAYVTLHVGAGTFQPVRAKTLAEHRMHGEHYEIPAETVAAIGVTKKRGSKVIAVGTTTVRCLEASAAAHCAPVAGDAETDLFITPGFEFRVVDRLITNFHLPRSTLLVLVSAFAGIEPVRRAYRHAIEERYRFYSYGDAMLVDKIHR